MHTPRFSGQPINAGDLVFEIIPSLPIRTSCENVGTVILFFLRRVATILNSRFTVLRAQTHGEALNARAEKYARAHNKAERCTANPEKQARDSVGKPREQNVTPGSDSERLTRLFGAGAPFRPLFYPIPSSMFRDEEFPSNYPPHPNCRMALLQGGKYP